MMDFEGKTSVETVLDLIMISTISVDVSVTGKLKYEATNLLHKIPSTRSRVSKGSTRGTEVIILFAIFQPSFLFSQYECHH